MGACVSCRGREQATHPLFEGAPAWEQRLPQGNEWMPPPPEPERIYSFDKYEVEKELGRGEFGVVSAVVEKATGNRFAIKSISKEWAQDQGWTEAEIMFHLSGCSNVLRCYDVFEDDLDVHLVLELCNGGSWYDRLAAKGVFPEAKAADVTRVLLRAVHQCHSLGVVHRDIKADNLLWSDDSDDPLQLRLADWGLAELAPKRPLIFNSGLERSSRAAHSRPRNDAPAVGSTWYMSPEVLHHRGAGKPADVWSIGILLYLTLTGRAPFDAPTEPQVWYAIKYEPLRFLGPACQKLSVNAKDILSRMLTKDPRRRASVAELLAHPWLSGPASQPSARARSANANKRGPAALPAPLLPAAGAAAGAVGRAAGPPQPLVPPDVVVSRLQAFAAKGLLDRRVRRVAVSLLHEKQVSGLMKLFRALDVDCDGFLNQEELHNTLISRGWHASEAQAQELLAVCDQDGDGLMSGAEFIAATLPQAHLQDASLMEQLYCDVFGLQDSASGATLVDDTKLLRALAGPAGIQIDTAAVLKAADMDGDGVISFEDFTSYLSRQQEAVQGTSLSPPNLAPGGFTLRAPRAKTANTHLALSARLDAAAAAAAMALDEIAAASIRTSGGGGGGGGNRRSGGGAVSMRARTATALLGGRRQSWVDALDGDDDDAAGPAPAVASRPSPPSAVTAVTAVTALSPEASLALYASGASGAGPGPGVGPGGVPLRPRPLALLLQEAEGAGTGPSGRAGGQVLNRVQSCGRAAAHTQSEPGHTFRTPSESGRHQTMVQFNLASVELEPPAGGVGWRPHVPLPYDASRKVAKKSSMKKRSPAAPPLLEAEEVLLGAGGAQGAGRGGSVGGGVDASGLPAHLQGTGVASRQSSLKQRLAASPRAGTGRPASPSAAAASSQAANSASGSGGGGSATPAGAPGETVSGIGARMGSGLLRPLSPLSAPPQSAAPLPNSLCTPRTSLGGFESGSSAPPGSNAEEIDADAELGVAGMSGPGKGGGRRRPGRRGRSGRGSRSSSKGGSSGSSRNPSRSASRGRHRGVSRGSSRGSMDPGGVGEREDGLEAAGGREGGARRGHSLASSASSLNAPLWREDAPWHSHGSNAAGEAGAAAHVATPPPQFSPSRVSSRPSPSPTRLSFRASAAVPHLAHRPSFGPVRPLSRASSASSLFTTASRVSRNSRNSRNSRVSCNSRGTRRGLSRASSTTSLVYTPEGGYRLVDPLPWSPGEDGRDVRRRSSDGGRPGSQHDSQLPAINAWGEEDSCLTLANQLGLDESAAASAAK